MTSIRKRRFLAWFDAKPIRRGFWDWLFGKSSDPRSFHSGCLLYVDGPSVRAAVLAAGWTLMTQRRLAAVAFVVLSLLGPGLVLVAALWNRSSRHQIHCQEHLKGGGGHSLHAGEALAKRGFRH